MSLIAVIAAGCSDASDVTPPDPGTAQVQEKYSNLGTERIIPVRVINCLPNAGAPDRISLGALQHVIEEANEVYKAAGIQFFVSKVERYVMPVFEDLDDRNMPTWPTVRDQLKLAFPSLQTNAWPDIDSKEEGFWMDRVATVWGAPNELIIWAHTNAKDSGGNQRHYGVSPEMGRAAVHIIGDILGAEPRYIFAHEVGHALNLGHPYQEPEWRDPKDVTARTGSDVWDLVYTPGNPNRFYASRTLAGVAETGGQTLSPISTGTNCVMKNLGNPADGTVQCVVNGVTYQTGGADGALKGMGLPGGPNVMGGIANAGDPGTTYFKGISDSQIENLQKTLRYEMPLPPAQVALIAPPVGVNPNSDRPDLGTWDVQRSGVYPLDFDGDGKRDLAVWDPPATLGGGATGTFRIRGSRLTWNTQWTVNFGVLGDVPFVQDFNADGCTDVGVWRTSGSSGTDVMNNDGYFVYCPSTGAPNCPAPTCATIKTAHFGYRSDVPLNDSRYHGAVGEIAIFRPSTGEFWWKAYVSGGGNGGFPTPYSHASFGGPLPGAVPLTGDYDDDGKTDPALYAPSIATFGILRSNASYAQWNRVFPSKLIPENSPNPSSPLSQQARAGGFPIEGMGILAFSRPAVYFPQDGTFNVMWDVATPSAVVSCGWGGDEYFPVSPSVDGDGDWRSDMVVFSAPTYAGNGTLYFKKSHNGDCAGATSAVSSVFWDRPRMRVFSSSSDMTGDGKPEIVLIDPDSMTFFWAKSDTAYTTQDFRQLGSQKSVPL